MDVVEFVNSYQSKRLLYHITPDVYDAFQNCSGDRNPLHTDSDYAQKKGFPECVMYGNILNAFVSHFVGMALPTPDIFIQTQDIQYRKPVFLNDTILLEASIEKVSYAVEVIVFNLHFYRSANDSLELVAKGHVQIGLLHDK